jgi:tripartite ATP-independent transporter DctM subunit
MLLLLLLSIPVASTMGGLGFVLGFFFSDFPLYRAIGEVSWAASTDFVLFAIPLFILLGQVLVHSGAADKAYRGMDSWLSWLPGGLLHANIATSALFAATSGSSVATAATIGTIGLPQARKFGYNEGLFSASIAAGGTLGILIPPSINMIIYGFLTNTSIPQLFLAGFIPGVILSLLFMAIIILICLINPSVYLRSPRVPLKKMLLNLFDLIPIIFIFLLVIGSIYTGFATPTEAAALGVIGSLIVAFVARKLSLQMLYLAIEGTMRTTGMIMFILVAANFLNFILISLGLTDQITRLVERLGLSPFETLLAIILMYVIMGFFIETLSIMVLTIPVIHPIITTLGFNSVWFGVILILLIEMALITPPVGLNLYVVQGVRGRGSLRELLVWITPFVLMICIMIALLIKYPSIALFLKA